MRISIFGTRGIPNQYGGFEQFAEMLSAGLVAKGVDVTVYSPKNHYYKNSTWNGVSIIHKFCLFKQSAPLGQIIYDLICILDSRHRDFDVIYQLGYTSSSVWYWLHPRKSIIVTNMDGIEWRRIKYNFPVKIFLKYAEKLAVRHSHLLIADSMEVKDYLDKKYGINAQYIPYGSAIFQNPDPASLSALNLKPDEYYLLIARFQPDNNLEMIIRGFLQSETTYPLLLVGDYKNHFGHSLRGKYPDHRIIFQGSVFDKKILDNLRFYSKLYFHGHSAGGTNPSLLEAMGAKALICAYDSPFNREVLENNSFYFKTVLDITEILTHLHEKDFKMTWIQNNCKVIENKYNWEIIFDTYFELFGSSLNKF